MASKIVARLLVLWLLVSASVAHASLVEDGGFESAPAGYTTGALGDGWTATGTIYVSSSATLANTGTQAIELTAEFSANTLSQIVATVPGQSYTLSFHVASDDGVDPLVVSFGGTPVFAMIVPMTFPALGTANGTYLFESLTVAANSSSTVLAFQDQYLGAAGSYGTLIDDVSLTPLATTVPEPGSLALLGLGFTAIGFARRKRNR